MQDSVFVIAVALWFIAFWFILEGEPAIRVVTKYLTFLKSATLEWRLRVFAYWFLLYWFVAFVLSLVMRAFNVY